MKRIYLAALLASVSGSAIAQTYPSPTFQNLTILGNLNIPGTTTFGNINVGTITTPTGSIWSDWGNGVYYDSKINDRLFISYGVNAMTTFDGAGNLPSPPGTNYIERSSAFISMSAAGLYGIYGACSTSLQSAGATPAYFGAAAATITDSGGGTPGTYTNVAFSGGHGTGQTATVVVGADGHVQGDGSVSFNDLSGSGYYSTNQGAPSNDVLTASGTGLPSGLTATLTNTWAPGCIGIAATGLNTSVSPYLTQVWVNYWEGFREAGTGSLVLLEGDVGNGGNFVYDDPWQTGNHTYSGWTAGVSLLGGGSSPNRTVYTNPASVGLKFSNNGAGFGMGVIFSQNAIYNLTNALHSGSSLTMGKIDIAMPYNNKIAWFSTGGGVGAWINGPNSTSTVAVGLDGTKDGWFDSGGLIVTNNEVPEYSVTLPGIGAPLFQVQGAGAGLNRATAMFEAYNTTGIAGLALVSSRNASGPLPGGASNVGDVYRTDTYFDTGNNFAAATEIRSSVASSVTDGLISTLGTQTPGTGCTGGPYTNQSLTGGTGTGAQGTVTCSGGGASVTLTADGSGYLVGDVLSTTAGGTTGFSVPVATTTGVAPGTLAAYTTNTSTKASTLGWTLSSFQVFSVPNGAIQDSGAYSTPSAGVGEFASSATAGGLYGGTGSVYDSCSTNSAGSYVGCVVHGTTTFFINGTFQLTGATWADNQTCTAGQITFDANYIYACTATNTVKHAALSNF